MSYQTWHTYGYGVCVDDIGIVPVQRLQQLLDHAPVYHAEIQEYFQSCGISQPEYDDYIEYDEDYHMGLASLLMHVIKEAEHFEFTACDDFNCNNYLLYEPAYPWSIPEHEKSLTEEAVRLLLAKYISILTDEPIEISYQSVENGG